MNYLYLELFSIINIGIMVLVFKYLKKQKLSPTKQAIIFTIFSLLTVFIHYIDIIRDLLIGVKYTIHTLPNIYFLPVYPCNIMMWLNVIMIPLMFFRTKASTFLANFIFLVGSACAFFGLVLNENFLSDPNFLHLYSLKAITSHVFLLYSCISLKVFDVAKIRTIPNLVSSLFGALIFIISNLYSNYVLTKLGRDSVDSMFFNGAGPNLKFLNFYTIFAIGLIILITLTTIYENKKYPLNERWYYRFIRQEEKKYE